jgi:hypothetical protein
MTSIGVSMFSSVVAGRPTSRVLVAVAPPLLAALLSRLLESGDVDVVVYEPGVVYADAFDVAIVTADVPSTVVAQAVIRLPDEAGNAGTGSVLTEDGLQSVYFSGINSVVDVLSRLGVVVRINPAAS